jgi:hypothetical protein
MNLVRTGPGPMRGAVVVREIRDTARAERSGHATGLVSSAWVCSTT